MALVSRLHIGACSLWLLAIGGGSFATWHYQAQAGKSGVTPGSWPAQTNLSLDPHRPTLIMFAHPKCPCTRASMEELNRLLGRNPSLVNAKVVFLKPSQTSDGWMNSGLVKSAASLSGVQVIEDTDGALAQSFGAETSGHVLLYQPDGRLLFSGGITSARGHYGDNAGESAVESLLAGSTARTRETPVYGCSLGCGNLPESGGAK